MRQYVVFNSESAYLFYSQTSFRDSILDSEPLFCDSASLSMVLNLMQVAHARLHGPDFMHLYLKKNPDKKILIIGGHEASHKTIAQKYELGNTKFLDQKVDVNELRDIFSKIEAFQPSMIFVCLGLGRQELVANAIYKQFRETKSFEDSGVVGVGAAVDFLGGAKKRSGPIWQALGMEWLPRLIREPRMLPRVYRSFLGCLTVLLNKKKLVRCGLTFASRFPV